MIVGIVLITLLVIGIVGYVVYQNVQQQVLFAAKNSEQNAANQAPSQLQITCFTVRNDNSHLSYSLISGYSGYLIIYETFGVSNPTKFVMEVTWTLTVDFTSAKLVLISTAPFHLSTNGVAYPTFTFQITGAQYNNLPPNADFSQFSVTLDGSYAVTGAYSTYNLTQHSTYDTSTNTGSGSLGSSGSLPKC